MPPIVPITIAYGDGIGPEIMESVLRIFKEAEVELKFETIEVGEKLYQKSYTSGIAGDTWESLSRTKILLKAPITTPQGGGYKSLNVTLRKALSLYANIRPSISYHPFIKTLHPELDLIIIRENEEDLYAGVEYRSTHNMYESLKLISRVGSEKIIRFAFEYALKNNRKKVTCFSKDNIMKFTDGIFHKIFNEIASQYPNLKNEHHIIDIGTAKLATTPAIFDIIVTSNLYGDIISDVTAAISGSVGIAGSANIGNEYAMFEAVHGSAPDIAGKNIANPSGLLNAAIMMLVYIGHGEKAALIENAWKKTIEDGVHTIDIYNSDTSSKKVGTKEFTHSVIERLGEMPKILKPAHYQNADIKVGDAYNYIINTQENKTLVGADIFVQMNVTCAHDVASKIADLLDNQKLELKTIAAKGLKLWPREERFELLSDHWCCRFMLKIGGEVNHQEITDLLKKLADAKIDFIKIENLYEYDGVPGFSLAQGE